MEFINKDNFVKIFLSHFLSGVSLSKLKKLNCLPPKGYLWNACGWDLIANLKGATAMKAYDEVDKEGAFEFQYDNGFFGDDNAMKLSSEYMTSQLIKESGIIEFYVIGKDFSWCYIVTHERDECGPYFIKTV